MSVQASTVRLAAGQAANTGKSLYEKDHANYKIRDDFPTWFREAARQTGLKPMRIFLDYMKVRNGPGRLLLQDYFLYRLYDNAKFTIADKRRFISDSLHSPVTVKCCDMSWQAMTEDKWVCYTLLKRFGLPIPETVAVIDKSPRGFADTPKISTVEQFKSFLRACKSFPLFCKVNNGVGSFGAFIITGVDGDMVLRDQAEPVDAAKLFASVTSDRTYILQKMLRNHSLIRKMTKYVATVRMVNFVHPDRVRTPFAALKLPGANNIADNYWRKGNMIADIDLETGRLRRAIRGKGVTTEDLEAHPDTGDKLIGMQLPYWKEIRELNALAVSYFTPVRYNSLDIAITDDGPVVVEINTGSSFELLQLAMGKGLLTDENEAFFRSHGAPLKKQAAASKAG